MEARRKGLFSSDFEVTADGDRVTTLDLARLRSRAEFDVDGHPYAVRPEGLTHGAYVLERDGHGVTRAERTSLLPLTYRVRTEYRMLELRARLPTRTFVVRHGDRQIGVIRPAHLLSRSAVVEGLDDIATEERLFLVIIVLLRWRRRARAASSGGG